MSVSRATVQASAIAGRAFQRCHSSTASSSGQNESKRPSSWRLSRRLIYPVLLTSAVSSLAINLRNARDEVRVQEDEHRAQMSVLRDLVKRLQAGESIARAQIQKDYERVGLVKRSLEHPQDPFQRVTWREMLLGRRNQADMETERRETEEFERVLARADDTSTVPASPDPEIHAASSAHVKSPSPPQEAVVQRRSDSSSSAKPSKSSGIFI